MLQGDGQAGLLILIHAYHPEPSGAKHSNLESALRSRRLNDERVQVVAEESMKYRKVLLPKHFISGIDGFRFGVYASQEDPHLVYRLLGVADSQQGGVIVGIWWRQGFQ